ncbi:hypothetical protein Daesc_007595 [Daldinia eschscholtzii]|uniref:Uncharacterized protein n=1 Tax=Daldinia eschscholtzii TaxID=292717 RepID=A0AAX6MF38_9PEZI
MESEVRHIVARAITPEHEVFEVACYNFNVDLWFALSPSTPVDAWPRIWNETVRSVWLFAMPTRDRFYPLPNPWRIAMQLRGGRVIVFEIADCMLQSESPDDSPSPPLLILFRAYTDDNNLRENIDKLIQNSVYSTGRRLCSGAKLKDIVYHINRNSDVLTNYSLVQDPESIVGPRGRRFWILRVLARMKTFFERKPGVQSFYREADHLMRQCWLPGQINTGHFGYEDEEYNPLRIVPGADTLGGSFLLANSPNEQHEYH